MKKKLIIFAILSFLFTASSVAIMALSVEKEEHYIASYYTEVDELYQEMEFDMDEAEYNDSFVTDSDAVATYTLKQFIDQYGVPELSPMEKENLQHLSAEEQLEVVKWIPDQMLIDELSRRVSEYRTYADAIREASDKLRIYV